MIIFLSQLAIVLLPCIINRHQETNYQNTEHQGSSINMLVFFQNKNATKDFIKAENKTLIRLLKVINLESYEVLDVLQRRKNNLFFMQCLMEIQLGYPQALLWLKKHLNLQACNVIISDWHHSPNVRLENLKNTFSTQNKRIYEYFDRFKTSKLTTKSILHGYELLKRLLLVIVAYLDLIFDAILLMSLLIVLDPTFVWNDPNIFSSQVGILLLASIVVPLLKSAVTLANKRPLVVLDSINWINWKARSHDNYSGKVWPLRIFIVICNPLVPAMLVFSSEKAKEKQKYIINHKLSKRGEILPSFNFGRI